MLDSSSPTSKLEESGAPPPRSVHLIVAVTATWTVSLMRYCAQAQLLTPIMDEFGRGEEAVGWLFSLENAALALSTLAAAGPLARRPVPGARSPVACWWLRRRSRLRSLRRSAGCKR